MSFSVRGCDKRRKRPFGDDGISGCMSNSYFCCEAVNRLREDINILCQDVKRLAKLKSEMETEHKRFEIVCLNARHKLKYMAANKVQAHARMGAITEMRAIETRDFLKYTWSLANQMLDKKARKSSFQSVRGGRAVAYVNELVRLSKSILSDYISEFHHEECSTFYTHLDRQLQNLLAPEILKADSIEFSSTYINSAIPAITTFMAVIDLYLQYPRVSDVITLYNEIFNKSPAVSNRPCKTIAMRALASWLRGPLIGEKPLLRTLPVVEGRVSNFCSMAAEVAQYILKKSVVRGEPANNALLPQTDQGLTDPRFYQSLSSRKIERMLSPQFLSVPSESPVPVTATRMPYRARGRPRKRAMGSSERPSYSGADLPHSPTKVSIAFTP